MKMNHCGSKIQGRILQKNNVEIIKAAVYLLLCHLDCTCLSPSIDSSISDQDVLQQYSSSSQKRSRSDQHPDKPTLPTQPRPRNRFATLLQRRNQEAEEDGQATCSRWHHIYLLDLLQTLLETYAYHGAAQTVRKFTHTTCQECRCCLNVLLIDDSLFVNVTLYKRSI